MNSPMRHLGHQASALMGSETVCETATSVCTI